MQKKKNALNIPFVDHFNGNAFNNDSINGTLKESEKCCTKYVVSFYFYRMKTRKITTQLFNVSKTFLTQNQGVAHLKDGLTISKRTPKTQRQIDKIAMQQRSKGSTSRST